MKLLTPYKKDQMGEFWNQIVEICDKTELSPMEVSFILRRIMFTIDCYCQGEAQAKEEKVGSNMEKTGV